MLTIEGFLIADDESFRSMTDDQIRELHDSVHTAFRSCADINVLQEELGGDVEWFAHQAGELTEDMARRGMAHAPGGPRDDLDVMQEQRKPASVQTFILSKDRFKTEAAARKWIKDNDRKADKIDEKENSFRVRQFPPGACKRGSLRTIKITNGVQAVVCRRSQDMQEQDTSEDFQEAGLPVNPDGSCPVGYPKKRRDPESGEMRCFKGSGHLQEDSDRVGAGLSFTGMHDHPHTDKGIHFHFGFDPETGAHDHSRDFGSGGHRHRNGDPIDGFHIGQDDDVGSHAHILALREEVPELWDWYQSGVDAHYPRHRWLPGFRRSWVSMLEEGGEFSAFRATTREDWEVHGLWNSHSAGANLTAHAAVALDEKTNIVKFEYEFVDGTRRPVTLDDYIREINYFDAFLPFPEHAVFDRMREDNPDNFPTKLAKMDRKIRIILEMLPDKIRKAVEEDAKPET